MQTETQHALDSIKQSVELLKRHLNLEEARTRILKIEETSSAVGFWNDQKNAQNLMREKTMLENKIQSINDLENGLNDQLEMLQLANDEQDQELISEIEKAIKNLSVVAGKKQIETLLSGEADKNNCFVEIHPGAGGTEAQDWAAMLFRMYTRWAEQRGFKVEVIDETDGEEAGIKSATIRIIGDCSYGWMKTESGVHRLVRISPFDSSARRHTSFSSIWVYPEIDDNIEIDIEEKDLRIDTFRASGAGGQHVNTTDSAIRITHIPTNIIVQCQSDRSQHRNKATAMKMLRARLYELERSRIDLERSQDRKTKIGSGDRSERIRTYNFPQGRVTDHRINLTLYKLEEVLNGDLEEIINGLIAAERLEAITAYETNNEK